VHNLLLSSAGITLALFGGVQKHSMDKNKVPVRGDIHVIIVGMLKSFFYLDENAKVLIGYFACIEVRLEFMIV